MEETSTENAKISDSGYSNTCSNSQSHRSSDSSRSRNSNRSVSSGYGGGHPSTFDSRNEAGPQVVKRKDKDHKKKKSKASTAANTATEVELNTVGPQQDIASYNPVVLSKPILDKKTEEVATVELVDATDPGEHNGEAINDAEVELASPARPLDDSISQANDGFCAVISMRDGRVLYTTPSICTALGYPRDSWSGQSFIDYVDPMHKSTLTEQIAKGIALPEEDRPKGLNGRRASLFCRLRKNNRSSNLRRKSSSNLYLPFHLTLTFRDLKDRVAEQQRRAMFLVITAQPVHSAYKAPEETIISSIFTTRHTVSCCFSHVDPDVVQYFGYLPQDMIGRSLFDFYHPEDLPFIKDTYETVMRLEGSSFRSKPYRFAVQNGGYVVLDTEWSCFVNPWTRKLEFVIGQHRVLKGPAEPDVFRAPSIDANAKNLASITEEVMKESKVIEGEIWAILNQTVQGKSDIGEHDVLKKCKDLASFMENLLLEMRGACHGKDPLVADDRSFSEHDSVMLGEISPHHEYYDSKSSTETPPSYNQLNYNENLERFFKSKPPVATMYGSDEEIVNSNDDGGKSSPISAARKCMSPIIGSGASGSGSAENLSSGSNNQTSSASRGEGSNSNSSFKPPTLTTSLINRHNEDMEKLMMQKHRELRSSIKNNDKHKDSRIKPSAEKMITDQGNHYLQPHGVKRCGSHSWEGDICKVSKHDEVSTTSSSGHVPANVTTTVTSMSVDQTSTVLQTNPNMNLWPPISTAIPSMPPPPPQPCVSSLFHTENSQAIPRIPVVPSMIPVYYVPVPQDRTTTAMLPQDNRVPQSNSVPAQQNPYMFVPVSYVATTMAGVLYPPLIAAPPPGTMYRPFLMPEQTSSSAEKPQPITDKQFDRKGTESRPTSVKAEPGSVMAMSESSKKVLSSREMHSSCRSRRQNDYNGDESSSSSFYSSFFNKSSDCSYNPEQRSCDPATEQTYMKGEQQGIRKKEPPWLEGINLTPELIYEYQLDPKTMNEVLQTDMETLKKLNQPLLVNDQLSQLYLDLELEGFGTKLILEDGMTSSGSDSGSSSESSTEPVSQQRKHTRRMLKYGKLVMIHEENAPFPPAPPPLPTNPPSSSQPLVYQES